MFPQGGNVTDISNFPLTSSLQNTETRYFVLCKNVKLASFQENMLIRKTVFPSLCRSLWEDKLLYTLVPVARLFSRTACLAISHCTGVFKSCSRRMSFWDWGEYDDFSKVVSLVAAFGARVEIIFAHILVFPACAIEVQHINENSPTKFIDMFAPKWARGPHKLTRFPSWDSCITPGYWAWYSNVLPTSGSLIGSLFYVFMPREGIYTCVFCPPPPLSDENPVMLHFLAYAEIWFSPIS